MTKDLLPLVVKSKVKECAAKFGCRVGGDVYAALDELMAGIVKHATERAKGNGRKTIGVFDL